MESDGENTHQVNEETFDIVKVIFSFDDYKVLNVMGKSENNRDNDNPIIGLSVIQNKEFSSQRLRTLSLISHPLIIPIKKYKASENYALLFHQNIQSELWLEDEERLSKLTIKDKISFIFDICLIMRHLHRRQIFGCNFSLKRFFVFRVKNSQVDRVQYLMDPFFTGNQKFQRRDIIVLFIIWCKILFGASSYFNFTKDLYDLNHQDIVKQVEKDSENILEYSTTVNAKQCFSDNYVHFSDLATQILMKSNSIDLEGICDHPFFHKIINRLTKELPSEDIYIPVDGGFYNLRKFETEKQQQEEKQVQNEIQSNVFPDHQILHKKYIEETNINTQLRKKLKTMETELEELRKFQNDVKKISMQHQNKLRINQQGINFLQQIPPSQSQLKQYKLTQLEEDITVYVIYIGPQQNFNILQQESQSSLNSVNFDITNSLSPDSIIQGNSLIQKMVQKSSSTSSSPEIPIEVLKLVEQTKDNNDLDSKLLLLQKLKELENVQQQSDSIPLDGPNQLNLKQDPESLKLNHPNSKPESPKNQSVLNNIDNEEQEEEKYKSPSSSSLQQIESPNMLRSPTTNEENDSGEKILKLKLKDRSDQKESVIHQSPIVQQSQIELIPDLDNLLNNSTQLLESTATGADMLSEFQFTFFITEMNYFLITQNNEQFEDNLRLFEEHTREWIARKDENVVFFHIDLTDYNSAQKALKYQSEFLKNYNFFNYLVPKDFSQQKNESIKQFFGQNTFPVLVQINDNNDAQIISF